eukprot:3188985-Karenia_brevis.AAC.1
MQDLLNENVRQCAMLYGVEQWLQVGADMWAQELLRDGLDHCWMVPIRDLSGDEQTRSTYRD